MKKYIVLVKLLLLKEGSKDYKGIYRLLSYMNKDEGSEVNHSYQVFAYFSGSVSKLKSPIFCTNFVIVNFVIYKLRYI
jgi:hypothetical protein